jgi:hypothetical protein
MDTWIYREVLDVRCDMAMSRVLKSVDAAQSQRLEDEAVERVYVIARSWPAGAVAPVMFMDEPLLMEAWERGRQEPPDEDFDYE